MYGQSVSLFFVMNYIPMSILFTRRQWFLYKRFQIRNAPNAIEKEERTQSYLQHKVRWNILLWSTVFFCLVYSVLYGYYLYYALLVDPCLDDITLCPDLRFVAMSILVVQSLIYIDYLVCCILLLISMKRIHSTIK